MRLIDVDILCDDNGRIHIQEFDSGHVPKYAILSHTWEIGEVTFKDTEHSQTALKAKLGYVKIKYACEQARRHGFRYLWIDTCCIDSSSSAELSEAINSMYQWYARAEICYVYLSDMPGGCPQLRESISKVCHAFEGVHIVGQLTKSTVSKERVRLKVSEKRPFMSEQQDPDYWIGLLAKCKWWVPEKHVPSIYLLTVSRWYRGWTLQELIAPTKVSFYGRLWNPIAYKHDLLFTISRISGIDTLILNHECSLNELSVAKRLSWAANRTTTRREDEAYCLLGILDINMTLLYGEGPKAFLRLQEELIVRTTDPSLFLWLRGPGAGLFAPSPSLFKASNRIVYASKSNMQLAWSLTHRGLKMNLPVAEQSSEGGPQRYLGILPCYLADDFSHKLAIHLQFEPLANMPDDAYSVGRCQPTCFDGRTLKRSDQVHAINTQDMSYRCSKYLSILIPRDNFQSLETFSALKHTSSLWIRDVPKELHFLHAYPEHQWNTSSLTWNRHQSLAHNVCSRAAGVAFRFEEAEIFICFETYHAQCIVLVHAAAEDDTLPQICEEISNRCHRITQPSDSRTFRAHVDATERRRITASMALDTIMGETVWVVSIQVSTVSDPRFIRRDPEPGRLSPVFTGRMESLPDALQQDTARPNDLGALSL